MVEMTSTQAARTSPAKRHKAFERELRDVAAQWFSKKGFITHAKMDYCLRSHDCWPQNIICDDVVEYIRKERQWHRGKDPYLLHKYFHHGLSSQAMAFNLLGPLIVRRDLEPFRNALDEVGISWPRGKTEAVFEYDDRKVFKEVTGQPTSIDLMISGTSSSLFVEAKFTEKEFGGCSIFAGGDCEGKNPCASDFAACYLHRIGRTYWQRLSEHEFIDGPFQESPICLLANYYQFFREVLFAISNGGSLILLHDDRNPTFYRVSDDGTGIAGLWPFLMQFVPERQRKNIGRITIQQVVRAIESCGRHSDWIDEFKDKYGIDRRVT
jgi:hypothetical protein